MKKYLFFGLVFTFIISCSTQKNSATSSSDSISQKKDTIQIANQELEYEVIIIDVGFYSWLANQARPRGFYSEGYLESRNQLFVQEWNSRARQPQRYDQNLYEMQIDYDRNTHYGYEVNYLLFNYFTFFQINYKQQLVPGFSPRL